MNIQQLEYIIAVDRFRHFAKAAQSCGVSQPTLSMMIQKLEIELGVDIFDRKKSPIEPTTIGAEIISQARVISYNLKQLGEIANSARDTVEGELNMAIIPTLAPYIIPKFFGEVKSRVPDLKVSIAEIRTSEIVEKVKNAELELALISTPINEPGILELPLFYERFIGYISPGKKELYSRKTIDVNELDPQGMWLLQEGHCFRNQMINICQQNTDAMQVYEAGSIETLIRIVDINGGYTLIPELHLDSLTAEQKRNIRFFSGDEPRREISFIFRENFVKERLINELVEAVKAMIPASMLDNRLSKFRVKL